MLLRCALLVLCAVLAVAGPSDDSCHPELIRIAQSFPKHLPEVLELRRSGVRFLRSGLITGLRDLSIQASCTESPDAVIVTALLPLEGVAQVSFPVLRNVQVFFDATVRAVANVSLSNETVPKVNGVLVDKVSLKDFEHGTAVQDNTKARKFVERVTRSALKRGLEAHLAANLKYALLKAIAEGHQDQDRALILEKRVFVYKLLDRLSKRKLVS